MQQYVTFCQSDSPACHIFQSVLLEEPTAHVQRLFSVDRSINCRQIVVTIVRGFTKCRFGRYSRLLLQACSTALDTN